MNRHLKHIFKVRVGWSAMDFGQVCVIQNDSAIS